MSEKNLKAEDFIKLQKEILKSLKDDLEREKGFGLEDGHMARSIQKNIDAIEKTIEEHEKPN